MCLFFNFVQFVILGNLSDLALSGKKELMLHIAENKMLHSCKENRVFKSLSTEEILVFFISFSTKQDCWITKQQKLTYGSVICTVVCNVVKTDRLFRVF